MSNKFTTSSKEANTPQRKLKSIQPSEEIALNITKNVSGSELSSVLKGVDAFTQCFKQDDKYIVDIKVHKIIDIEASIDEKT